MFADLQTAIRLLRRAPGYVAVVVLTLGLGIGGVAAVFTLADPMIFRSLPWTEPDRVVEVRVRVPESASRRVHADDFVAIADNARTLDAVSTISGPLIGTLPDTGTTVLGGGVSRDFLRLTGLQPVLGRVFTSEEYDDVGGLPQVAMLTWPFWQEAFGGATDVVGRRLAFGGSQPYSVEIVGVLPQSFFYPDPVNQAPVFISPGGLNPRFLGRTNVFPTVLARVRSEFTFAQAEAELDGLLAAVERANPDFVQGRRARLMPLQEILFTSMRTPLLLLFIATACLLLLALVNLMHLAQARAQSQARDLAVRVALGASRWRVMRLLLIEAAVLTVLGAAVGLGVGHVLFTEGMARAPEFNRLYRLLPGALDTRVVIFIIGLGAAGMLAVGLLPARRAMRRDIRSVLARGDRRRSGWRAGGERLAIVGQTAFAVGLVVTCLLVVRSFAALVTVDRGFDPAGVIQVGHTMPEGTTDENAERYRRLVTRLNQVPGVEGAGVGNGIPALTLPEGVAGPDGEPVDNMIAYQVSERFPDAMAMRLVEGRMFSDDESFGGAPVAVIDRSGARMLWGDVPALGQTIRLLSGRVLTVVGVLDEVKSSFYDDEPRGTVLTSLDTTSPRNSRLSLALRLDSRRPPSEVVLAAAAADAVPGFEWNRAAGLTSWERLLGQPRFLASTLGVLAVLTMLLAGFGVMGVVTHLVSRRTREIGIRMALGADRRRVLGLVLRQAILPAAVGVVAGLGLAFWWSAAVRAVIVGISPRDPWSFAAAGAATMLAVFVASLRPAARASRIDPARTLRAE